MKYRTQRMLGYRLQLFAEAADENGAGGGEGEGADGGSEEISKKPGGKMFTQEELDAIIEDRIGRERAKLRETRKEAYGKKESDTDLAAEQAAKVSAMEAKLLCYEQDVAKESVSDVVALAKAYMDEDTDLEAAIKKVLKKYPNFVKSSAGASEDVEKKKGWGTRQKGSGSSEEDGVEAAFLKRNPGLKV
ncbi:MAG: hypothetical protein Q4C48_08940 [Lachnospiraceae bacterium]|nr:hypothetical protein [Lachnospiraceae bacterium]